MIHGDATIGQSGIGLRQPHWQEMMERRPATGFLEIHAENFLGALGREVLEDLRRDYSFSVHAVGMSLARADGVCDDHLLRIRQLIDWLDPLLVSDHLCWTEYSGVYFNDLMPFPYTEESYRCVRDNINKAQDRLQRVLLIENLSSYLQFKDSVIAEADFLARLTRDTGCQLLCDVNNAFVNQANHGHDALTWLRALPPAAVREIHLAGHVVNDVEGGSIVIDNHGNPVIEPVWDLYAEAVRLFPSALTLIEWDTDIPPLDTLLGEARRADQIRAAIASTPVAA